MKHLYLISTTLVLSALISSSAMGAVILNPTLVSGPGNVIDPTGGQDVDQSFGTAQATLEARSDLRVLQDFTGFGSGGNNVVSFTDGSLPDIQFQFSGDFNTGRSSSSNANGTTSTGGNSLSQDNDGAGSNTSTLTISFGTWNGSTFTANQTVDAAAFTFNHVYSTKSGSVTFKDAGGSNLASALAYTGQSDADGSGNHRDIYFGWDATAETTSQIGSIEITFTDSAGAFDSYIDDFAFTVVPEPSTGLLLAFAASALTLRRRRA